MNPQSVQKLKENVPELRELIAFLQSEAAKLDTLVGINIDYRNATGDIALEVMARIRAKETIDAILKSLLDNTEVTGGVDPKEFVA